MPLFDFVRVYTTWKNLEMRKNLEKWTKSQKTWKIPRKWARAFSRSLQIKKCSRAFGARKFQ